jgi:hypothetical protein
MDDYNFEDFTETHYRDLLRLAKKKYSFIDYSRVESLEKDRFILWRHDVDFSVNRALALAKIEKKEGISAIYFLRLSSDFYNIFELRLKKKLETIFYLGHRFGLHFDVDSHSIHSETELIEYLSMEKKILESLLNTEITVFSFHNPTPEILTNDQFRYAGMINTYARYFREDVGYCSDSNGYWRNRRLWDVLEKAKEDRLQVLTHPVWWQETVMSPKERVWRCIDGRAQRGKELYLERLERFGRKNIHRNKGN